MDNKLRSVVQFALYILLFSVKNTMDFDQRIEHIVYVQIQYDQVIYLVSCLLSYYYLSKFIKTYCNKSNEIQTLTKILLVTLMLNCLQLENLLGMKFYKVYRDITELLNQTILFYTWLVMFEQNQKKENIDQQAIKPITIFKVLFCFGYPINSGLEIINRIIFEKQREYQVSLGLELVYGIVFLVQYGVYIKQYQIRDVKSGINYKQHDPFDEELADGIENENDKERMIYDYFRFSVIGCLCLIINTIVKVLQQERTNISYIKQTGIIVVYVIFISNLIKMAEEKQIEHKSFLELSNKESRSDDPLQV
ncbi:unnamed protein product [Paramecium sonneborni]|uniref:Transmembrane protein n=1 Tax=Paramecium sonneborni TaxID=65129 RepID=A0A8S1PWI5_9CILI|nr:unnamed protein product [Paramecium sonneborni]